MRPSVHPDRSALLIGADVILDGDHLLGVPAYHALTFGWLMDHGQPQMIYAIVIAFILLALVTAITRKKPQGTPAWTR